MPEFAHLHCHTQYSLLDGAARIKRLVGRAAEMEMSALAITDHGNLYGVPEFYTSCNKSGVQPIIGCEFYVTPSGMGDKSDRTRYHQVLLAKNLEGYRNLIKLSSLSYTDGYYYKPRIDRDTLRAHSAGLIATTCCLQGEVLQTILKKGEEEGERVFRAWLELFGEDYYIELQDHAIPEQRQCNAVLVKWAEKYGVQTIATNDVHYVEQADAEAQDILLCLQTGKDYHDPNRMRFENDQFFLKSIPEMQSAFADSIAQGAFASDKVVDAALDGTLAVARKCALDIPMGDLLMPHFPLPEPFGSDMGAYLRHLSYEGAKRRYNGTVPEPVRERIDLELGIIGSMGFDGYFLIVQDFTTAARDLGVSVGPGRGSAAGSIVAYCLGITNIDPLEYDLLFERFLNPERVSMPDIDIDFDDRGRGKVIDYVVEKYGRESVCQIVTYGTMGAKSVVKDVARVMGVPLDRAIEITKMIPDGVKVSLEKAQKEVPEFAKLWKSEDVQIRKMMHYCEVLEGSARHTGVHAAGVIIAPGDVSDYVPVAIQKGKSGAADAVVTQYDGKWVEDFGLLKMDFLGLKTLTILDDALRLIEENHGVKLDLDALPLDDQKTYRLFQKGDTVAIFQFESSGMREWMRKLKPTSIDDLIAMNALYRPGPMDLIPNYIARKHGTEKVEYPHPMLEEILRPTYGIPVYQEQVMQMAQVMGGYTLGGADLLRRCVTGDTLVMDAATGERVRVDEVVPGQRVLSLNADLRLEPVPVEEVLDNGVREVYRVRTRSGRSLRLTADHPLLTVLGWRHLSDLGAGDAIAIPASLPTACTQHPADERIRVLAYLLGDGCTRRTGGYAQATFYNSDPEILADYEHAVHALGVTTQRYVHRKTGVTTVTCAGTDGANPVLDLVREAGLVALAHAKRVPPEVFRYDTAALACFVGTLWRCDGSVEKTRLSYASSSEALIDDLAHLLLRLGIVSMRRVRATTHRPNYELLITDQRDVLRFADTVGPALNARKRSRLDLLVHRARRRSRNQSVFNIPAEVGHLIRAAKDASGRSWSEAGHSVGISGSTLSSGLNLRAPRRKLSRHRLAQLAEGFDSGPLRKLSDNDVLWDPIVSVEPDGEEQVYDLAVPPFANFVADDVVVHNSMGKKKQSEMDKQRVVFVAGAEQKGVPSEKANEVFDMMAKFAGYGFNKCVVAETEVHDAATGTRTTVGDLFDQRDALNAEPFTIHALDDTGRLVPRRVEDVVWNGVKPVYELTTSLGKRIVATGNHPFRTLGGWTNLENLAPGDRIAAPRLLSVETNASWPEHELIALAGLIAEGNTCHPSTLYFYSNERTLVEDFADAIGQFPNTVARIDERKNGRLEVAANTGRDTRFGSTPPWNKRGVKVQAPTRSGAFRWADRLGLLGKKADAKFVPASVFMLCDADLALFLGRLWAGDGFIANRTNHTPYYATSSEQLARDVQTLLLRLGLVSRVKAKVFKYRGTERPGYTVHLLGEGALPRFLDVIAPHIVGRNAQVEELRRYAASTTRGLTSKDTVPADVRAWVNEERQALGLTWTALEAQAGVSVKEFYGSGSKGKRGFRRSTIAKLARFFASERLAAVAESDVFWDEVIAITPLGERDTYDLTVEHDHNFVADGLIIHNSHSAAYSVVAYHTAYLKAHYPAEFMAAVLTTEMADSKKLAIALDATRSAGIDLLPPDVNTSRDYFTVETVNGKHCIRFGLGAIKGVGHGAVEAIEAGREKEGGRFTSIFTLCKSLDLRAVGKRTVEALAAAGALDSLEGHRAQLVQAVDLAWQYAQKAQANEAAGQNSLFGEAGIGGANFEPALPMVEPWGRGQKLREERDLIGFYVSGHPLDDYAAEARTFSSVKLSDTEHVQEGSDAAVCGIVTEVTRRTTKSGRPMAFLSVEDTEGACEVVLFSNTFEKHQHLLKVDEVLLIRGKAENRGGLKLIARDLLPMWRVRDELVKAITIRLDAEATDAEELEAFAHLCEQNRGEKKLYFEVAHPAVPRPVRLRSRTAVIDPVPEVMRAMQRLAGRDGVVFETAS